MLLGEVVAADAHPLDQLHRQRLLVHLQAAHDAEGGAQDLVVDHAGLVAGGEHLLQHPHRQVHEVGPGQGAGEHLQPALVAGLGVGQGGLDAGARLAGQAVGVGELGAGGVQDLRLGGPAGVVAGAHVHDRGGERVDAGQAGAHHLRQADAGEDVGALLHQGAGQGDGGGGPGQGVRLHVQRHPEGGALHQLLHPQARLDERGYQAEHDGEEGPLPEGLAARRPAGRPSPPGRAPPGRPRAWE